MDLLWIPIPVVQLLPPPKMIVTQKDINGVIRLLLPPIVLIALVGAREKLKTVPLILRLGK